jgi:hypothetical protein
MRSKKKAALKRLSLFKNALAHFEILTPMRTPTLTLTPPILVLPGWQNSGSAHWQSLWEQQLGAERVTQHDWSRFGLLFI